MQITYHSTGGVTVKVSQEVGYDRLRFVRFFGRVSFGLTNHMIKLLS